MISKPALPSRARPLERGVTISLGAAWQRFALLPILILSAALDFVNLSREGFDNTYYAAAVRSMADNWHAFFFASFDPAGFVTIDKPPLGFWFQVASVKLFGYSGVSLLLPEALAGVLAVVLLYHLVARTFGRTAGLLAALALAVTPISVATARNNTIDSILVLFVLCAAWTVLRAAETGKLRWLLLTAVIVGLGFNIKMLEAYLVLPAFGLVYLLGTRLSLWRRLRNLFLALIVLLAVSLSWAIAVDLTPASARPWVDSTTTNSEILLAIGYNGLQRLTGSGFASGGGPGGVNENGPVGIFRLLDVQLGSQIGWLLVLAILGFVVAFIQTRPRLRILDERQRSLVLWGVWLLTTGFFFSKALFYHTYYLVMVAPAISALAGIGIAALWQEYRKPGSRLWWTLPLCLLVTAGVEAHILASYPAWTRWLTPLLLIACVLAAICLAAIRIRRARPGRLSLAAATLAVLALLTPASAFAAYTMQNPATGNTFRAGPTPSGIETGPGGMGGFRGPMGGGAPDGSASPPASSTQPPAAVRTGSGTGTYGFTGPGGAGRSPGAGGPNGQVVSSTLVSYLEAHQGSAEYLVATSNSQSAAPIIIATGKAVMSLGGFSGSDPILTPAKLATLAKQGVVKYFLIGGGGHGSGSDALTTWIQQHSKAITVGGTQLYEYTG